MKNFKQVFISFLLASFMLVGGNAYSDVTLTPGSAATSGFAGSQDPNATMTSLLASSTNSFVSAPPNFNGSVTSYVWLDELNPYGVSALTFGYVFFNDSSSADAIGRMTVNGFKGLNTTAYTTDCCGFGSLVPESVNRSVSGDTIGVTFATNGAGVAPGTWIEMLVVYTDAAFYSTTIANFIDGGIASATVFAPIPEPEIYAMLVAGLGFMGFVARRRKQRLAA